MGKKLQEILSEVDSLILDTSFLLPYIGIRVKGIDEEISNYLEGIKLYYPYILLPELIGVIFKVSKKYRFERIPIEALNGLNTIIYGNDIRLLTPKSEDIEIAYDLIRKGLNDLFDALLYSTSIRTRIKVITGDKTLLNFLENKGFNTENILLVHYTSR